MTNKQTKYSRHKSISKDDQCLYYMYKRVDLKNYYLYVTVKVKV